MLLLMGRTWKGRWCCFFFLLLSQLSPIGAVSFPDHLAIMVKNDSMTLGVSENPDDLRSYGSEFSFSYDDGWYGTVNIHGLTNRSAVPAADGRYDELELFSGHAFRLLECSSTNAFSFTLEPSFGMIFSGDLGLGRVQNFWHKVIDVPIIDLRYDDGGDLLFAPLFSLTGNLLYSERVPWFDSTDIFLSLKGTGTLSPGYEGFLLGSMEIGQRTAATRYLLLGFGYAQRRNFDGRATHRVVNESEDGLMASFDARFGLLVMTYRWHLQSFHGFGGFGIDIGGNSRERWSGDDLVMTLSVRYPIEKLTTSVRYILTPALSVFASNSYKMEPLSYEEQIRENLSTWHFGLDYELSLFDSGVAVPFIAIGAGFKRFLLVGEGEYPDSRREIMYEALRFSGELSGGLRFLQQGDLQWSGVSYGVELSAGVMYLDNRDLPESVEGVELLASERWQPVVRVGVTMGSSL
jgi:hypothetical protein